VNVRALRKSGWRGLEALAIAAACLAAPAGAASCVAENALRVTQSIDVSGPQRWVGVEFTQGAQLYLRRLNREGGVHGRPIRLHVVDDRFDPKLTAANVAAASGKACAIFGTMGTAQTLAAVQAAGSVPLIAPLTGTRRARAHRRKGILRARYVQ